jgi:transaldolase
VDIDISFLDDFCGGFTMRNSLNVRTLRTKLFADGADLDTIVTMSKHPWIRGFTTNPTLMRKAGVLDYADFARKVLCAVPNHPVSFEVFADDPREMLAQARVIAGWGCNVNVKVPVTNTRGEFTGDIIRELSADGVALNITAVMTAEQVRGIVRALDPEARAIVSVFAGRIADTGIDPVPVMVECLRILKARPAAQLLWASPRELLNVVQADRIGCDIITATADILNKLGLFGKDLLDYSLETVQMFHSDAAAAGYSISADCDELAEPPQDEARFELEHRLPA